MSNTDLDKRISDAVEAGASTEEINSILSRAGRDPIKTKKAKAVDEDIPVGDEFTADMPVDQTRAGPGESQALRARRITDAAFVKAALEDKNEFQTYDELDSDPNAGSSGKEIRNQTTRDWYEQEKADLREVTVTNPDLNADTLMGAKQVETEIRQEASSELAPFVALTDSMSNPLTRPEDKERAMAESYLYDQLAEFGETVGWQDLASELALDMVPFKTLMDSYQVSGTVLPWNAEDRMREWITNIRRLPADDRARIFPHVKETLQEVVGDARTLRILEAAFDPTVDEQDILDEFGFWSYLDLAIGFVEGAAVLSFLKRATTTTKTANRLNNKDKAVEVTQSALADQSGKVEEATGVDVLTAADNSMPFTLVDDVADYSPLSDPDLSSDVQRSLGQFQENLSQRTDDIAKAKIYIREGIIPDDDIPAAVTNAEQRARKKISKQMEKGTQVSKVEVESVGSDSVTFNITTRSDDGQTVVENTVTELYQLSDIGEFQPTSVGIIGSVLGSPRWRATGSNLTDAVNSAIRLDLADHVVANELRQALKNVNEPIRKSKGNTKKRVKEVDDILLMGDEDKHVFKVSELRSGVSGIKLDDAQIDSYYRARAVLDAMGDLADLTKRKEYVTRGVQSVRVPDSRTGAMLGTPYQDVDSAKRAMLGQRTTTARVFDQVDGTIKNASDLDLDEIYGAGKQLVTFEDSVGIKGAGIFKTVIVGPDDIKALPARVLQRHAGYVPRKNLELSHFVQEVVQVEIDGVLQPQRKVVRGFNNKKDADDYAAELNLDNDTDRFVSATDRELEKLDPGSTGLNFHSGNIFGPRRDTKPPFGKPGEEASETRIEAMKSIELYAENLKSFVTRNQWRMGQIEKWENTARKLFPDSLNLKFDTFQGEGPVGSTSHFLKSWRDQINMWSGFRSEGEMWWDGFVQGVINKVAPPAGSGVSKSLHTIRHGDPTAMARASAFHTLLGMFNPIQWFVQAQGAVVSAAVLANRPGAFVNNVLRRQNVLRLVEHLDPQGKAFAVAAKAHGMKTEDLRKIKQLWDKSGMYGSMLSNADVDAALRGYPTTISGFRRVLDSGLLFYREGEGFNRRLAFLTALEDYGFKNIDNLLKNETELRKVQTRANDLIMNLGRANRASFQRGLASIPTQFLQVTAKNIESVLTPEFLGGSKTFSKAERTRIMMAQVGLYGAAGIPLGTYMVRQMLSLFDVTQDDLNDPEQQEYIKFLNGGAYDLFTWTVFGADLEVGNRASLVQEFNDLVLNTIVDPQSPIELFFGPAGEAPTRFLRAWSSTRPIWGMSYEMLDQEPRTIDSVVDGMQTALQAGVELGASPFSTWNNYSKWKYMNNLGMRLDRTGTPIVEADFNKVEKLAALIGFEHGTVARERTLSQMLEADDQYVADLSDELMNVAIRYLVDLKDYQKNGEVMPPAKEEAYINARKAIAQGISDEQHYERVMDAYDRKFKDFLNGQSKLSQSVNRALKNIGNDMAEEYSAIIGRMAPISQEPPTAEEENNGS